MWLSLNIYKISCNGLLPWQYHPVQCHCGYKLENYDF